MKIFEESFLDPSYLSIKQAAQFLGVSHQTLRRWEQEGKLKPVRHPMNRYRYYLRSELEPLRLEYKQAELAAKPGQSVFMTALADISENVKLRAPQREAWAAVREHFRTGNEHAILQIPVGCGKTGVIATLPFGTVDGKVLVIAPNVTIRDGVAEALDLGPKNFWRKAGVLASLKDGPFTAVLDGPSANIHDCMKSDFVVVNIQQLASAADRWLPQFPPNFFSMVLVDEGHHNVAPSWRKVFDRFPEAKVVSLTATPFRGDKKQVAGKVIYRYAFTRAMLNGYIKQLHSYNIAPEEIYFTYRGEERHHTLDEVLELREEQWFSKGVALSTECNKHIVEASIEKLNQLRQGATVKHQIIAAACSVDHARQIRSLYEERNLKARELYSEMDEETKESIFAQLEQGRIDCVVQVQMLGEGYDHPPLSVAAIFRPFRSLSPFIQFVGRALRVIKEGAPTDPDNRGYVVSHVGLNNDPHWEDFRELDLDDQEFFKRLLTTEGEDGGAERVDGGGGQPRRFDGGMRVSEELLGNALNLPFLDPDDDRVLDQAWAAVTASLQGVGITPDKLGLTREKLKETLKQAHAKGASAPPEDLPVSPQKRRQALKKRLNERCASVAARVLMELKLNRAGRDVGNVIRKYAGDDNTTVVTRMVNAAVNEKGGMKGKDRARASEDQLKSAYDAADAAGDEVCGQIQTAMGR
jgi:superfamily II DNA or RNA helicase